MALKAIQIWNVRDKLNQNGGYVQTVSKAVITPGYKTHEIDTAPGYRLKYSDGFYNMQAKGYGIVDLYVDRTLSTIDRFEVTPKDIGGLIWQRN